MNLRMPQPGAPISGPGGLITREWRDFLTRLLVTEVGADLQRQIAEISKRLDDLGTDGDFLPKSTLAYGESSVASFGTLAGGLVTFTLQGDNDLPGETFYYGTGPDGAKGWFPLALASLSDVSADSPNDGDALVWSESMGKWIPAPVSFSFGSTLTDESGNVLTDQYGNPLTDGQFTVDWTDVENKPSLSEQAFAAYTLATLPALTPAWRIIAVTDLNGGAELCFTDGTTWRRCSDKSPAD